MTTLEEIEQAVTQLTPEQIAKFRAWFEEFQERAFTSSPRTGHFAPALPPSRRIQETEHINTIETVRRLCPDARHEFKKVPVTNHAGEEDYVIVLRVYYRDDKLVETTDQSAFVREGDEKRKLTETGWAGGIAPPFRGVPKPLVQSRHPSPRYLRSSAFH